MTRACSPVFSRTDVPGGNIDTSMSSALIAAGENSSFFDRTMSRIASYGRVRPRGPPDAVSAA